MQQRLRTLHENVTPVQSFAAETYFTLIVITKEPYVVIERNILFLILEWWRLPPHKRDTTVIAYVHAQQNPLTSTVDDQKLSSIQQLSLVASQ